MLDRHVSHREQLKSLEADKISTLHCLHVRRPVTIARCSLPCKVIDEESDEALTAAPSIQ